MNIPEDRAQALKNDLYDPNGYAGRHYAASKPCPECGGRNEADWQGWPDEPAICPSCNRVL